MVMLVEPKVKRKQRITEHGRQVMVCNMTGTIRLYNKNGVMVSERNYYGVHKRNSIIQEWRSLHGVRFSNFYYEISPIDY